MLGSDLLDLALRYYIRIVGLELATLGLILGSDLFKHDLRWLGHINLVDEQVLKGHFHTYLRVNIFPNITVMIFIGSA